MRSLLYCCGALQGHVVIRSGLPASFSPDPSMKSKNEASNPCDPSPSIDAINCKTDLKKKKCFDAIVSLGLSSGTLR